MIDFDKIDTYNYVACGNIDSLDTEIKNIIEDISVVGTNKFNGSINISLYETILSRKLSGLFLKYYEDRIKNISHVLIRIGINNNTYNITLGSLNLEESSGYLNGITKI